MNIMPHLALCEDSRTIVPYVRLMTSLYENHDEEVKQEVKVI